MRRHRVLFLHSQDFKCPNDYVILDGSEKFNYRQIEKIAKKLLKKTVDKEIVKKLEYQNDKPGFEMLCYTENGTFKKVSIEIKTLANARQLMLIDVFKFKDEKYLSCDVPLGMKQYNWDIHYQDSYPHRSREALRYVRPDGCTETAFHSLDLPNSVDIEKLEILGLQSELKTKTTITNKVYTSDVLGIFDNEEDSFDRFLHLNEVEKDRDVMWLKIKN